MATTDSPLKRSALALRRAWYRRAGLRRAEAVLGGRLQVDEVFVDMPNRFTARAHLDDRQVFVKLRRQSGSLRREAEAHRVAAELDLPAARLLAYVPGVPEVLVTDAVDGRALADCTADADWERAGEALRRFHDPAGVERLRPFAGDADWVQGFERRLVDESRRAAPYLGDEPWLRSVTDSALAAVEASPRRRTAIHGDLQAVHVLVGDDGAATFIDLDACGVGDPWFDVAVLGTYAGEFRTAVLRGYDPALAGDVDFLAVEHAYAAARFLSAIVWRGEHGYDEQVFVKRLREHDGRTPR